MLKPLKIPICLLILMVLGSACEKTEEAPATTSMESYYPLQVGKFITYRLDSTVYDNLNTVKVVRSYVVRDMIDEVIKDNLGRDTYRIRRMIRSNSDTTVWTDNATFLVYQDRQRTEFMENNLRFIKLINPIRDFQTWKGNSYINVQDDMLNFYDDWDYFYDLVGQPYELNGTVYPETLTVEQIDELLPENADTSDKSRFYILTRSSEVYAKGIGLIYKDFLYENWDANSESYEPNSYGVKLTLLNHNF
jgi:hypothetical protein